VPRLPPPWPPAHRRAPEALRHPNVILPVRGGRSPNGAEAAAGFEDDVELDIDRQHHVEHLVELRDARKCHEMMLWAKGFEGLYPEVKITIEAAGSATAPSALLEGQLQFGPMSQPVM
jgi:hypothetical protein